MLAMAWRTWITQTLPVEMQNDRTTLEENSKCSQSEIRTLPRGHGALQSNKKDELLIYATNWIVLKGIMLSGKKANRIRLCAICFHLHNKFEIKLKRWRRNWLLLGLGGDTLKD